MRVLIVDHEPLMRQMLREWVTAEGGRPMEAISAEDALIVVTAHGAPGAVLCNVQLPQHDGIWLAERLREECPQTAVITITPSHGLDVAMDSFHAGVVDHLIYPFTAERLVAALTRARVAYTARKGLRDMQREVETSRIETTAVLAELENSMTTVLEAMLALRRPHEREALARVHRLARLATNLALALEVREPELSAIERAVFLQDPLSLPTQAELDHLGILKHVPLLAAASDIATAVHERHDGSGFPLGLRGEQIPLSARIIAVAAAYENLASSVAADLQSPIGIIEILRTEGARFDPQVLNALSVLHPSQLSFQHPQEPVEAAAQPVLVASGKRGRRAAEAAPTEDPRRRWFRKRLASAVTAELGGKPAHVVDISYGGFRVELPPGPDTMPSAPLALDIPFYRIHAEATCKWTKPKDLAGPYSCGAAVNDLEPDAMSRWRAFVDALPQQPSSASDWS